MDFDINQPDDEVKETKFEPLTPTDKPQSQWRRWHLAVLVALAIGSYLIITKHTRVSYQKADGAVFGTFYHINYQSREDLQAGVEAELKRVDESLSMFNPNSIISRMNQGEDVVADSLFTVVFRLAEQVSEATDGAFDITVAPLVNAWGFGFKNDALPDSAQVDSLRQLVGYKQISLTDDGRLVKADPNMILDCSAVAKGFGVDVVANYLLRQGVENFMVEIGGEVVVSGKNPKGELWHVGINKPVDDPANELNAIDTIVNLTDIAMATSGNYRNFYTTEDGRRVAHTIDPATGYPVQHSLLSATVFAPTCAEADAFATSFMVMGLEGARDVLARHPELRVYFIYDSLGVSRTFSTIDF
ncbi:MAG: FAD:protein FMN transferase [Bacteroidales bacterium]|nr:FAD:protein FMN transferase [Bacteroidales bacterium]